MYYFYYFVRIFREIFGRRALKKIVIIGGVIAVVFLLQKNKVFGYSGLDGDDTYTDPNNSIFQVYDGYLNDLAVRLNNSTDEDVADLIDRLSGTKLYSFICYYGTSNEDYNNDFKHLRVVLFTSDVQFADSSAGNQWHGMNCQFVYNNRNSGLIYDFTDLDCIKSNLNSTIYFPYMLINRFNPMLVEVLNNKNGTSDSALVGAINNQTDKIEEGNAIAQETQDFVTDDSLDSNEMNIDTSNAQIQDNTGINDFYSTFLGSIQTKLTNYDETEVTTITIPLPHDCPDIVLRSDLLSRYIRYSYLNTLISVFWTFLFGGYIISYVLRMIKWLTTGRVFSDGGVSDFIWYLDVNNEIIKGYMM